mmetsp:Transcript_110950/g.324537  ORF Transcript_110950/g.324537 Transcript_110950/m.324537 type:complete len:434 (-) Transcript_110950:106-1407(-)
MLGFHEALWVTVASFASVSIRHIPFHKFWGKARGAQLRAAWYWTFLLLMGGFLLDEFWRFPDPSKRLPDSFRVSLPYYVNVPAHVAVWLSYLMTAYHLYQFRHCRRIAEEVVDYIFDILLLPVSFGLLSLHCIRILPDRDGKDLWGATATLDAAEVWESWALWSFQTLFMRYVDGSEDAQAPLYPHFKRLCLLGVQQYVVFNFASNIFEFIWREVDRHDPGLCDRLWGRGATCEQDFYQVQDYIIGALWYSCTIAIYSIVSFERAMSRSLHPIDPVWKFWGAKLIVSIAGVQRLFLFALTKINFVTEVFAWYLHAYLLCFETLFLSVVHFRAYPASGYFKFGSTLDRHPHGHGSVELPAYGKLSRGSPAAVGGAEVAPPDAAAAGPGPEPSVLGRRRSEEEEEDPEEGSGSEAVLSLRPHAHGRPTPAEGDKE